MFFSENNITLLGKTATFILNNIYENNATDVRDILGRLNFSGFVRLVSEK